MKKITIVQRRLTHYRVAFFDRLRIELKKQQIELQLLVGEPTSNELLKNDGGLLKWATPVKTRYFIKERLCWLSIFNHIHDSDLTIITQENWQISNIPLLLFKHKSKIAFWGHGANLQRGRKRRLVDIYKDWTSRQVAYWFAYTELTRRILLNAGVNNNIITVVNNCIDETEIRKHLSVCSSHQIYATKKSLDINGCITALYIGSLHKSKNISFLIQAARLIKEQAPNFRLVIIGDGPDSKFVKSAIKQETWIKWVGEKRGMEKVFISKCCDFIMNPGMIGLSIVDSFYLNLPIVTTNIKTHSPEFEYLINGFNGIVTDNCLSTYVDTCIKLIRSPALLNCLRVGCDDSSGVYTLDGMVSKFSDGIISCLRSNRHTLKN